MGIVIPQKKERLLNTTAHLMHYWPTMDIILSHMMMAGKNAWCVANVGIRDNVRASSPGANVLVHQYGYKAQYLRSPGYCPRGQTWFMVAKLCTDLTEWHTKEGL